MNVEEHLNKYVQELLNVRTQLEFAVIQLKIELEEWVSGRKQAGSSAGVSSSGSTDVHQTSSSTETPGPVSQGPHTMVDSTGSQVTPVSSSSS